MGFLDNIGPTIILGFFLILLLIAEEIFPYREFEKTKFRKNILFHFLFAGLVLGEVWLLNQWPIQNLIPQFPPLLKVINAPPVLGVILTFIVLDFFSYMWHRLNHKNAWLWQWHVFHHQTETMDPLTAYRFHPFEIFMGYQVRALLILGIGFSPQHVGYFVLTYGINNLFQHSNLRIPNVLDNMLSYFIVTPSRHHVHHLKDIKKQNSNFATIFIFWDKLFGTYCAPATKSQNDIGLE